MKKTVLLLLTLSTGFFIPEASAQTMDLYEPDTICDISITFTQPDWDYQMDTAKSGGGSYLLAAQIVINGVIFDSVGVKYKGNSSYSAMRTKNPLHIKLDYIKGGQNYMGYEDLKLNNGFKDPSCIREVLSYRILRQYMHAPQANYAWVQINGADIGLYTNVEDVNSEFSGTHFYSTGNTYFKCNPQYGGGDHSDLVWYGADSSLYFDKYELQSDFGWNELLDLIDTLNNYTSAIDAILDVDRALWMHAFNNVLVNLDSYSGAITQNYYLYRDNNPRFSPVVWDLNECFGAFSNSGSGPPLSVSQMQNLTPLLHETDANWPLIRKLMAVPMYKRMYIAHLKTIVEENFSADQYVTWATGLQALIDSSVNADANKLFTYANFLGGLTTNVTSMGTIPGLSVLMDVRTPYLEGTSQFTAVAPSITGITLSAATPSIEDTIWVTATVSSPTYTYLGYRYETWRKFSRNQMYDDGAHGDGAAGDGVYGAQLICGSGAVEYYIYAENANAGIFSPVRAEHEFYILNPSVPPVTAGAVVVNEFMASNTLSVTDDAGQYADWIELYNNTAATISLSGSYLTDDFLNPTKWAFPSDASIAPYSYLIVWCDEDIFETGLHSNFKLSAAGEQIMMSYGAGNVIDSVTYGIQTADVSSERCPNGTGAFAPGSPHTYNAVNCIASADDALAVADWTIFPVPANDQLMVRGTDRIESISMYDAMGRSLTVSYTAQGSEAQLDVSALASGIYFLSVNSARGSKIIIAR